MLNKHAKKDGKPFMVDDARQRLIELHLYRGELDRRSKSVSRPCSRVPPRLYGADRSTADR